MAKTKNQLPATQSQPQFKQQEVNENGVVQSINSQIYYNISYNYKGQQQPNTARRPMPAQDDDEMEGPVDMQQNTYRAPNYMDNSKM